MKNYCNSYFSEILKEVTQKATIVEIIIPEKDVQSLQYYLTSSFYYTVVIDDYLAPIVDKNSLLEAMYYQVKLVTMYDLNWDALEEALNDLLKNLLNFEGVCLILKTKGAKSELKKEISVLREIFYSINNQSKKQLNLLINT